MRSTHHPSPIGPDLDGALLSGLRGLGLELPEATRAALLAYVALLAKWNRVYNLTAVHKPLQMVTRHLLDSLSVLDYLKPPRILDIGTGAGLPGIPLAMARPDWEFVLLDSNRKKTRFVTQAVAELGLGNATVVHSRVEDYQPDTKFTTIVSRAYSTTAEMVQGARHLCAPDGVFLAMKGAYPVAELEYLPEDVELEGVHELQVPGLEGKRHVVVLRPRPKS